MCFPVKCFTCGKVLGDKYRYYLEEVRKRKHASGQQSSGIVYLSAENRDKTIEGHVLDSLKLFDACCRTRMLAYRDIYK